MTDRFQDNPLTMPGEGNTALASDGAGFGAAFLDVPASAQDRQGGGFTPGGSPGEARFAIQRGKAFLAQGDLDLAVSELTQAIRLAPDDPEAFLLRGEVCEEQGEDDQAIADYSAALQIDVSQLLSFAQRLLTLTTRRDFDGAVADADQSLRVNQRLCRTCFRRGALYARKGEWSRAATDYTQVLQLDPANSVAFLRRGDASARMTQWAKAVADYTEALRLDPKNTETFNNRGEALLHLGQSDQALADFTEALWLDPHFSAARINRADTHLRRGEFDLATTDYNQAIHLAPGTARPYLGRGLARIEKGDWERALADLTRALMLEQGPTLASETQKVVDRLRSSYDQMVAGLNQFKRLFRQVVTESVGTSRSPDLASQNTPGVVDPPPPEPIATAICPPPVAPSALPARAPTEPPTATEPTLTEEEDSQDRQRRIATRHCRRGQVLQQEGDNDRAIAAYSSALAADRGCLEALLERGHVHRLERRSKEALADFNAAIKLEATAEGHFRRGVAYAELREFDRAFADFDEAIRLDPDHAVAYLNRGLTLILVGEYEKAVEDANRALEVDPSLTRARFLRGVANGKLGRHDLASRDFDQVLAQEPDNARAHNHRGLAHAAEGNYAEAIAAYDEAIRLEPAFGAAFFNRGIAYHLQGDSDRAIATFTRFIEQRPQHAPAHHQRGLAHLSRKEYDAAIEDFTNAFQLDPNLTEAYVSCLEATRLKYERAHSCSETLAATPIEKPRHAEGAPGTGVRAETAVAQGATSPARVFPELPPEPQRHRDDSGKETRSVAAAGEAARTVTDAPTLPAPPSGKLQLECPECGTVGLLDVRNLGKKFRCPGCEMWWRTGARGLEETLAPEEGAAPSPRSGVGMPVSKPARCPVVPTPPASSADGPASVTKPVKSPADSPSPARAAEAKPTKGPVGKPQRRRKESNLRHTGLWLLTAVQTRAGRWVMVVGLLAIVALSPFLFPSMFPSELRSRSQKVAQAWLARDAEQLKAFTDPTLAESIPLWLEKNPPPQIKGDQANPVVNVAVKRNDGQTAEVLIQIKATRTNGTTAHYAFQHRWVSRNGTWYVQPEISPTSATGKAKAGR